MVVPCNPSPQQTKAVLAVQIHPLLYSGYKASLGHKKNYLKQEKRKKQLMQLYHRWQGPLETK